MVWEISSEIKTEEGDKIDEEYYQLEDKEWVWYWLEICWWCFLGVGSAGNGNGDGNGNDFLRK